MIISRYERISLDNYNEDFLNHKTINVNEEEKDQKDQKDQTIHENALKTALDIRKFEIELYWKRATYFWAFIAVMFAGYFAVLQGTGNHDVILMVICCLGFVFSLSWYMVNKGSKFWQNNWEHHVDLLEDKINGPLYKTIIYKSNLSALKPKSEYAFSVSKTNQILSFFLVIVWVILALMTLFKTFLIKEYLLQLNDEVWNSRIYNFDPYFSLILLVLTSLFGCYMLHNAKSEFWEHIKSDENEIKIIQRKKIL